MSLQTYSRKPTKGRILLPKELSMAKHCQTLILTVAPSPCRIVFDEENWEKLQCIIKNNLALAEPKELVFFKRFVIGFACEMAYPKSRYLSLPSLLKQTIINSEEILIIDYGNRVELWDKAEYASKTQSGTGILPQTARERSWSKILSML